MAPRVLILTASIGAGHDLPAELLAQAIREETAGAHVEVADGLANLGPIVERIVMSGADFSSRSGNLSFEAGFFLGSIFPPTRALTVWLGATLGGRRLLDLIDRVRPDVIVSTYPGMNPILARFRRRGKLGVPVVAAITDLAALRHWAVPGMDLHLITHPESAAEVKALAPASPVLAVRGFSSDEFFIERTPAESRRALELPAEGPIVVVSGGGWAVGDLEGGAEEALALDGTFVVALCGEDDVLRDRLDARFGATGRFRALGFTDRMPDLLRAADVLVHSTAGLTVLEAHICGCAVISYGWGRGHIRANNKAFERFGLATVATDRPALDAALGAALAAPRAPDPSFAALPSAAGSVLALAGKQVADRA